MPVRFPRVFGENPRAGGELLDRDAREMIDGLRAEIALRADSR